MQEMVQRDPLKELREYRELRRRRDGLIRKAAKDRRTRPEIGAAAGLSVDRITQILGGR